MNCLFVRAPFAGWIVDGVKLIEYRTRETLIRDRIGIIESGTQTVIGDVELKDCVWNDTQKMWLWMLSRPRRYAKPVPFEHKRGCITWALLDIDPDAQEIAPRLTGARFKRESAAYREALNNWLLEQQAQAPAPKKSAPLRVRTGRAEQ